MTLLIYIIRQWDHHISGQRWGKIDFSFYTPAYLSMILTRENSDGKTIDLQQSENCLKLLIKIAPNVSFRKSTSALTRRYIPPETKSAFDNTTPANRLNTVCCSNRSMQLRIHTRTVCIRNCIDRRTNHLLCQRGGRHCKVSSSKSSGPC